MTKLGEVCIHGSLRRQCEACDLADQLAEAMALVTSHEGAIERLTAERDAAVAVLSMTVARLGGEVEGAPTQRINFLQRIDALREIEAERDELRETP